MIVEVDTYIMREILQNKIPSARDDQDFIPFVRFNSSQHAQLRERGEGPYGSLQYLGPVPDFSRSRRTARIWKYIGTGQERVRVDRYPLPVFLDYQINMYTERKEQNIAPAQVSLMRAMPETFYKTIPVDIYGDGQTENRSVFFQMTDADYLNPLDQNQSYQVSIRYRVRAWIFFHSPVDGATFYNRAEVQVNLVDNYSDPDDPSFVPAVQETYTLNP